MPRSNWKGNISFGLVSIPIMLYPSQNKAADISFHQIDKRDNARIKYQRVNANTGKEVPWSDITRGYEYAKDEVIPVPDEVLTRVAGDNARTIDIETFVNSKDLNIISIINTYYLAPDKKGEKGYVILREALKGTHKIGIAKVIISTKEYLAAIMPYEDALILCLLRYDKEIRKLDELNIPHKELSDYKVQKKEVDIAKQLIDSMSSKWHPEKYIDEYQAAIHKWVEESAHNKPHTTMKKRSHAKAPTANFIDLLKKSMSTNGKGKVVKHVRSRTNKTIPKSKHRYAHHAVKH